MPSGTPASGATVLGVRELTTVFYGRSGALTAVDRVSFDVSEGEVVALVGESGSGKSVTALSIMGLLDRRVAAIAGGEIRFEGIDLRNLRESDLCNLRGNRIAMVFQEPMTSLNPSLTIGRQLTEGLEVHRGTAHREALQQAEALLTAVGIPDPARRLSAYPHEMSGGMRQRVMVAMALSCKPRLLIADEPTTALDVTTQAQILDLIKALTAQTGTAMLLITHDLGLVARYAQRVNVMYSGRLVEQAAVERLYALPQHPYTRGLLASMPRLDVPRQGSLVAIEGLPPAPEERDAGCAFRARCTVAAARCSEAQSWVDIAPGHRAACWRAAGGGA
jgi:oligopeptide transport system ATP-binding protein